MCHRWAALAFVLALCALPTISAAGQQTSTQQPRGRSTSGVLGKNYPNPFNPETRIPFKVVNCEGQSQHVVSMQIYNVLAQLVAVPTLFGDGRPLTNLSLGCGDYTAYWDGKVVNSGREAASGVYLYMMVINGERLAGKMFVAK